MIQQFGTITEGKLRGRTIVIPEDKTATIAVVERAPGTMQKACLIHEKFIGRECDECKSEEEKNHRGYRRQITEI